MLLNWSVLLIFLNNISETAIDNLQYFTLALTTSANYLSNKFVVQQSLAVNGIRQKYDHKTSKLKNWPASCNRNSDYLTEHFRLMSLPAWADTENKKVIFGSAKALDADADTLSDFYVCSAFVEEKIGNLIFCFH